MPWGPLGARGGVDTEAQAPRPFTLLAPLLGSEGEPRGAGVPRVGDRVGVEGTDL